MKTFEISQKAQKNGRRKFKLVLHEIYPDSVVDKEMGIGSKYNLNGITWIREYCEKALPSIKGMSLRCEFLDEERTELCGHGETDIIDGEPIFENAVVIGTFEEGYIEEITNEDGETITACIGVGTIDSSCYHNLCVKLDENIKNGIYPSGSVEIIKNLDEDGIKYLGGYVEKGRIPTDFLYSAYALLGVTPADPEAKLLELNTKIQKEEKDTMTDVEIKALVEQTVSSMMNHTSELNQCKEGYEKQITELNEMLKTVTNEKNEAIANSEKIQAALDECIKERDEKYKELDELYEEMKVLHEELGKAKAKERINELNAALADFSDEEKSYAQAEIDAFKENPIESEINSVTDKILVGIGLKAKKDAAVIAEKNSLKDSVEDIFSGVEHSSTSTEDANIF